jgi:DNA-binding transcriptional ArsR family regulator
MGDDRCDLLCLDLPRAEALRTRRVDERSAQRLAQPFRALADPTRLTLALALRDSGELCVCDLAWVLERAQNLVSHHLRALRSGGGRLSPPEPGERERLVRRAKLLAWGGNAWHLVEFAIAVGAGIAAGSIALIGFGADSLIEASSGLVVVWLSRGAGLVRSGLSGAHSSSSRRATRSLLPTSWSRRRGR